VPARILTKKKNFRRLGIPISSKTSGSRTKTKTKTNRSWQRQRMGRCPRIATVVITRVVLLYDTTSF
jgi:hypothetical protein